MATADRDGTPADLTGSPEAEQRVLLQHLATAAEVSSEAMVCLQPDGRVASWNPAAMRILGPALRLEAGVVLADAFTDRAGFAALVRRCFIGERIRNELVRVDGAGGRGGPALASLAGLVTGPDRGCITVVLRDISEEVAAQEVLAEAERRVQQAESLAHTGSFVKDVPALATQWSWGMYAVHRLEPGSVLPSREAHLELVHPDDRPFVERALSEALSGAEEVGCDYRLNGVEPPCWIHMAVGAKRSQAGTLVGISGVCQDVSERARVEARLQEALTAEQMASEDLRRLGELKDEFLATVSHELRNPITTVLGFSSHLRSLLPEHDQMLEPIERNARSMSRLIEILLDEARLAQGKVSLSVQRLEVEPTARTIIEERLSDGHDQRWTLRAEPGLTIDMDPDAFALVLGNLVSNAIKYGAGQPITITAESSADGVVVAVADGGPGIPPEYQEHLFEAFYRIPGSGKIARGSGLGLSIVRRYVELHGGSIDFASEPGEGATFTFEIPTRPGDPSTWSEPGE